MVYLTPGTADPSDRRLGQSHGQTDDQCDDGDEDQQREGQDDVLLFEQRGRCFTRTWSHQELKRREDLDQDQDGALTRLDFFWYRTAFLVSSLARTMYSAALETFVSMLLTMSPCGESETLQRG